MKIERIYIGGWFQRTTLQLSEIYDFVRDGTSQLKLDKNKLQKMRTDLDLAHVEYNVDGLEYLMLTTNTEIQIKIFEDGLIVLNDGDVNEFSLFQDIESLAQYYEKKLSPAFSYLFSLGAPVPKELANIETVYPYFIVLNNAKEAEMQALLSRTEKQKYFDYKNQHYDVVRGNKYYFINNKTKEEKMKKNQKGITLVALVITILFSYDEKLKCSNSKGFLLATI